MKLKTKKIITLISFILCAVISVVALILFALDSHVTEHGGKTVYASTELIQMKRGEKLAFSEANEYFESVKKKYGDKFQVHAQGAYHVSVAQENNYPENVASMIYIDKDGYINTVKTGIYQLEYTFAIGEPLDETDEKYNKEGYEAFTFTALVCVYEGDEDKFESLPDDPWVLNTKNYSNPGNYILTKDVTWKADVIWTVSSFYGTILNPNGYTLTWDIGAEGAFGGKRQVNALFGHNYGYIDGLKVKVIGSEDAPLEIGDFHGLVERNNGVLQNCEIEGVVKMSERETNYDPDYFYALPKHGFSFNNEARMTVYSNNEIYAYAEGYGESDFAERLWQSKGNKVYLDAWYYQDDIKAQRREVKTILATERDSNTCEHLLLGKATEEEKTITLQIPITEKIVGVPTYQFVNWTAQGNTPLAIDDEYWSYVRWGGHEQIYENLEVKHWLVNGKKVDNLNEIVVSEDLTIEPFVQYKETKLWVSESSTVTDITSVYSAEEVLDFSEMEFREDIRVEMGLDCLGRIFSDPRCMKPKKIIIGKNLEVCSYVDIANEDDLSFLLDFLHNGGQLIIDGENPYVSFIDGKSFCNADGTRLYFYFDGKEETEVSIHPQITSIVNENTFWNGSKYEKLHLSNVQSLNQKVGDYLTNLKEINLGKELDVITGGSSADNVYHFLSRMSCLTKVEVGEEHLKLKAQDSFVSLDVVGKPHLLYAPKTLKGEVRIPDGIVTAGENCFSGSEITHLIFPDSFVQFNGRAVRGMEKLEKLTFGASSYLSFTDDQAELPSLTSIMFKDTKSIQGNLTVFALANIDTIVLPDNLESFVEVFLDCKAYQISDNNPYWKTVDGVLYNKDLNELVQYPKNKQGDLYTVLDGTVAVAKGSFYETGVKEVIFPATCTQVATYAFRNSLLEKVEFKAQGEVRLFGSAFYGCKNLSKVTLQESVKLFTADSVFRGCESLKQFPYQNVANIGESAFRETGIEYFEIGDEVFLGQSAFRDSQIKAVLFGATELQYINDYAFANTPLERVSLHSSITSIASNAFSGCKNLKEIDLKNVKSIGEHAFRESGLQSIESTLVETISEGTFSGCKELTSVSLPNLITIPIWAFSGSGVVNVYMPNVLKVDVSAFEECVDLAVVQFKDKVSVGAQAFRACKNLTDLSFTITGVEIQSFEGCSSLRTVNIEANIEERCVRVFADCTSLEEVTITGKNIAIGAEFFAGCTSLKKAFITDTGTGNGVVLSSAFTAPTQTIEVYLNVPETFLWKGKVPANVTVYVPKEYVEKFVGEWLAEEGQIIGFDFEKELA